MSKKFNYLTTEEKIEMIGHCQKLHEALDSVLTEFSDQEITEATARLFDRWVNSGATFNEIKKALGQMSVDDKAKLLLKIRDGGEG